MVCYRALALSGGTRCIYRLSVAQKHIQSNWFLGKSNFSGTQDNLSLLHYAHEGNFHFIFEGKVTRVISHIQTSYKCEYFAKD